MTDNEFPQPALMISDEEEKQLLEQGKRMSPFDALTAISEAFQNIQRNTNQATYAYLAAAYAEGLRLLADELLMDEFAQQAFFQKSWRRHSREPADVFRKVAAFLRKKGNKDASMYGKVMVHLYQAGVLAENAAARIEISGGVKTIAREGFPAPPYVDPRDQGDGMDEYGNKIHYEDEMEENEEDDEDESIMSSPAQRNEAKLNAHVSSLRQDRGVVRIVAEFDKSKGPTAWNIQSVESHPRGWVPITVYLQESWHQKIQDLPLGTRARVTFSRQKSPSGDEYLNAASMRAPAPLRSDKA